MYINYKSKLACTGVLITTILLGCGDNKTPTEYLAEAKAAFDKGERNAAIISLKNVLKADKNNIEARFLLGSIYVQQGLWQNASKELTLAYEAGNAEDELILLLAKVYYNLEDSAAIEDLLLKNTQLNIKTSAAVKFFLAASYLKENDLPRGQVVLTELLTTDAISKYSQLATAVQFWTEERTEEAIKTVSKILKNNPEFAEAHEYQGYFFYSAKKAKESAQAFNSYLIIHPQASQIRLRYMMALVNDEEFQAAEKQADLLLAISPNNPLANQAKAQARLFDGDYENAKKFSELALRSRTDMIGASIIAGYSSYKLGQLELAYSHLGKFKNKLSLQHPARRLLNAIGLELGYIDDAYHEISNASNDDLDVEFLSLSSSQLFKQGDLEKAGHLLDKAQEIDPFNGQLAYQNGLLKMAQNDPEAIKFLEKAIESNPEFEQAISLLTMEHLKNKRFDKALQVARSAAESDFALSKTLEGVTYKMQGDLSLAEKAFSAVLNEKPNNVLALYNLANIAESKGDIAKAVELYQSVLTEDNVNVAAINAVYRIGKNDKYTSVVNNSLIELVEKTDYAVNESIILVGFYMRENKVNQAKTVLAKSLNKNPNNFALSIIETKALAFDNDSELALKKLDDLLLLYPQALQARKLKVAIHAANNDDLGAIEEQEHIVELQLGGESEVLDLIFLYFQNNNFAKAEQSFSKLTDMSNFSVRYNVAKGKIALIRGNFTQAIRDLKLAYKSLPTATILVDLVHAMKKSNRTEEALSLILSFEKNNKLSMELMLQKAELYSKSKPQKALETYKDLAKKTNDHYVFMNNIAYLYLQEKDLPSALSFSSKALSKAKNIPAVINTYGLIQLGLGNISEAVEYLSQAYEGDKGNHNYLVHYIQALFANGSESQVNALLLKVDKQKLNDDSLARLATVRAN